MTMPRIVLIAGTLLCALGLALDSPVPLQGQQNLPSEIRDSVKSDMQSSYNYPVVSVGFPGWDTWLAGIQDPNDLSSIPSLVCADLIDRRLMETLIPPGSIVYFQGPNGKAPIEEPNALDTPFVKMGLLWIWPDGRAPINVNEWLLRNGLAAFWQDYTPPNLIELFSRAEQAARDERLGIWGECATPTRIAADLEPTPNPTPMGFTDSVSGDGSQSGYLEVPQSGNYTVTVRTYTMSSFVETRVIDSDTGVVIADLSMTVFGPDAVSVDIYLEEGMYSVSTFAVGRWNVSLFSQ